MKRVVDSKTEEKQIRLGLYRMHGENCEDASTAKRGAADFPRVCHKKDM
jgi:hypothetical protein